MKKKELNAVLMDKLMNLNEAEIKKSKVLAVIFEKTTQNLIKQKMQSLENDFQEQAKFYGQDLEDYASIYEEIKEKYQEQLLQITQQYNELYINLYLELQEAECNQKIAISNFEKSYRMKQKISYQDEEYNRKMIACLQKKTNYDMIIEECQNKLKQCVDNFEKKMNTLFVDKSNSVSLKTESFFGKWMKKIRNLFTGKTKFNRYVIEPITIELELMDSKLPDIILNIQQETILFVAKIKQAKDETNKIFNQMI